MDLDETIVQLGTKLDDWMEGFFAKLNSDDRAAQGNALLVGIEIMKELDRVKKQGLAAIKALLVSQAGAGESETAQLVRGFEFAAKLRHTLSDELMDSKGVNQVHELMREMAKILETRPQGRTALAPLLDHPDPGVRASAGVFLMDVMPERALPVLRDIDENEHGNSAYFTAHFVVLDWDLKQKAASKP
jgi:Domain of unknown function (DUF2019)